MDHLPRPDSVPYNAKRFNIRFYAQATPNSNVDFDAYPQQCEWGARPSSEWYDTIQQASEHFQGFLQSWLYFGSISTFFRRPVDLAAFTKQAGVQYDDGPLFLNSLQLVNYVEEWLGDMDAFQGSNYMATAVYLTQARYVHEALRISDAADREPPSPSSIRLVTLREYLQSGLRGGDPREPMMVAAQAALFDLIEVALERGKVLQGSSDTGIHSLAQTQGGSSYEGSCLWDLMRLDGWCPSELTMIFSSFSVAGIYFASHIERPNHGHIHAAHVDADEAQESTAQPSSPTCSNRRCSLYQLDQDSYTTKHTDSCTGCDDMYVDNDELLGILRQRRIPIVQAIDETSGDLVIKLVEQNDETPYVAVSHIWADGLGNLAGNCIPRCQMLRISQISRQILAPNAGACYFWLDTLCCPPDSMDQPEEQNVALDLMRDTYAKAHTVLVLDRWLLGQNLCAASTVDALFRVVCSPWTRRLWTLQEGALARKLLIAASGGGLFDPDDAARTLQGPGSAGTGLLLNIRTDILHRWYTIRKFKDLDESDRFYALYSSLAFRTTSVLEDEPLCLATLFGFQVSAAADGKTHEGRMLKFWAMFDEMPAEIMDHYEARMTVPGFRWAPRSLVSDEEDLFPYSNKMVPHGRWKPAVRTDQGLRVEARGYSLHVRDAPLIGPIFVRHPTGFWARCTFSFDLDMIEPLEIEDTSTTPPRKITAFSPKRSFDAEQIALIYHSVGHLEDWRTQRGKASDITGTVASVQGVADDGTISVRRFGLFVLSPNIPQTMPTVASLEEVLGPVLAAGGDASDMALLETSTMSLLGAVLTQLPNDQAWLLD